MDMLSREQDWIHQSFYVMLC